MDISKDITMTFSSDGYCTIAPDVLNPDETVLRYNADPQTEASRRQEALKTLQKILDNTAKTAGPDFAKQVLAALEKGDLTVCMTNADLAASAIRDTLRTPQEAPNILQNKTRCFQGVMFCDSKHSDLMMRTMQSVLRDIVPHCNAVDMIIFPNVYQSIIDNTPPDAFRYNTAQTPRIINTAFEVDPQSVKARIHGALEQIKGAVSNEARQAINDTEARLDSIIASAQEQINNAHFYIPLNYYNLENGYTPDLSDKTGAIVSEANAIQRALWNGGLDAGRVRLGVVADVTPHGEWRGTLLLLRDKDEIITCDATNFTPEQFQYVESAAKHCQSAQEASQYVSFISQIRDEDTPSTDEQDNDTPGDLD